VGAALALLLMGQAVVSSTLARGRLEKEAFQAKLTRVTKAAKSITSCEFSVCFCKYSAFEANGKLIPHENALINGDLVLLHTYQDVLAFVSIFPTIFFSHQWLSFTAPDPNNVHFESIVAAAEQLIQLHNIKKNELFVWIDYLSIPQRNNTLKGLSISSLGVYASVCRYFIVVAPKTTHVSTEKTCDADTYQRRGWCRLEQWARIAVGGFVQMYIYEHTGAILEELANKPKWFEDSVHVFDGDFTEPKDKYALVDTVVGIWAHVIRHTKTLADTDPIAKDTKLLVEMVNKHKETIFPKEYFHDLVELLETHVQTLDFDDMVVKSESLPGYLEGFYGSADKKILTGVSLRKMSTFSSREDLLVATAALKRSSTSSAKEKPSEVMYTQVEMTPADKQTKTGEEQV